MIEMEGHVIRGAIFDIDGTLLDSMPIWSDLGARYLRSRGMKPEEGLGEILFPMTMEEGTHYLKTQYHLPDSEEQIRRDLSEILSDFYRREVKLKPGARELLDALDQAMVPMMLATVGETELERAALVRLGVWNYFQDMLVCEDFGTNKSEPVIYEECADRMNLMPDETAVFEDVYPAVHAAHEAGFFTVAVYDRASEGDAEIIKAEADFYCRDSLAEIL